MRSKPTPAEAMEAYLSLGRRKDPWPGTDDRELFRLVGDDAPDLKRELDTILDSLTDLPTSWMGVSPPRLGDLASERAKQQFPEFSQELCDEIGRLATWRWK